MEPKILVLGIFTILAVVAKESAAVKSYEYTYFPSLVVDDRLDISNAGLEGLKADDLQSCTNDGCFNGTLIWIDGNEAYHNSATMATSLTGLVSLITTMFYKTLY